MNWTDSVPGANELPFIEALHDHFLTQTNHTPTRGSNILDLVIRSAPEHIKVTEALSPDKAGFFTDHCVVMFEYNSFVNVSLLLAAIKDFVASKRLKGRNPVPWIDSNI